MRISNHLFSLTFWQGENVNDPYDLKRFVDAQNDINEAYLGFEQVRSELRKGQKAAHWMWFVFPQLMGLGHSQLAKKFAISSREEAVAYLEHPILGSRLRNCTRLVIEVEGRPIRQILGMDSIKFRSCMTLFFQVASDNQVFKEALDKYFDGEPDQLTLDRL